LTQGSLPRLLRRLTHLFRPPFLRILLRESVAQHLKIRRVARKSGVFLDFGAQWMSVSVPRDQVSMPSARKIATCCS
jgi:hypothetical protein